MKSDLSSPIRIIGYNPVTVYSNTSKLKSYKSNNMITNIGQSRLYSTYSNIKLPVISNNLNKEEFIEFFRGFTDGEGCFLITKIRDNYFQFSFVIKLHIDDIKILEYIRTQLGIGNITTGESYCRFMISNLKDLQMIIDIFKNHPLNTTKYLNFIEFEKAYNLYINTSDKDDNLTKEVLRFKSNMNKERIEFTFPSGFKFNITNYWLLGFIEAEGCFYGEKSNLTVGLSIAQSSQDRDLLYAIKDYLCTRLGKDLTDLDFADNISIYDKEKFDNTKAVSTLGITNFELIVNGLIPFLDSLSWQSKKRYDYEDWRLIIKIKELGLHYLPEGKSIILELLNQMNNYRLSTNKNIKSERSELLSRVDLLLNSPSNFELLEDGTKLIKSKGTVFSNRSKTKVALYDKEGKLFKTFNSMVECGKFIGIHSVTVKQKIKLNKAINYENKEYFIKQI